MSGSYIFKSIVVFFGLEKNGVFSLLLTASQKKKKIQNRINCSNLPSHFHSYMGREKKPSWVNEAIWLIWVGYNQGNYYCTSVFVRAEHVGSKY